MMTLSPSKSVATNTEARLRSDGLIVPAAGRQRHMVDLVEQREGEHVVRRAQHRVTPAVCTSVNTVRAPATPFTCVGLMTSNTMLTPCENRPVATLSIAALSDTFTGSSAPDATRPAICAPVNVATVVVAVVVGDARRQTRQLVLVDVDVHRRRVLTRHVVLDRDRRAGVDDDGVAVKVGRLHESRQD